MRYVPALDGLRALSVMLVFLTHRNVHFPGGWVGVDIFFILSGYLITSILVGEHETTGMISLPRFYMRRVCRLLPALLVVVCVAVRGFTRALGSSDGRPGDPGNLLCGTRQCSGNRDSLFAGLLYERSGAALRSLAIP